MNDLSDLITNEIRQHGPMPFHQFMRWALYFPGLGYYERSDCPLGRKGDFFTSPMTGPLFGELLAFQFAQWMESMNEPSLQIAEAGAHNAFLARDILSWLRLSRPALYERLTYWILEPSAGRRRRQQEVLQAFAEKVRWTGAIGAAEEQQEGSVPGADPALKNVAGICFSNELLDAFPVRRLGWDGRKGEWFEWGVGSRDGELVWSRIPAGFSLGCYADALTAALRRAFGVDSDEEWDQLLAVLPDGYSVEICPAAEQWWGRAAEALDKGWLLTFDYGYEDNEFLSPHRPQGTLRAYYQHHLSPEPLARPGKQDLTAHVNFSLLRRAGEEAGLETEGLFSQGRYLTRIAERTWVPGAIFAPWDAHRVSQFRTLTHPEQMGSAFRVLVQNRPGLESREKP